VLYERALPATRFPLVQLSMFRIPSFRVGVAISAAFIAGIPAFFFTFSLLLQVGLGFSALHAGLTTVPWSIGTAVASAMSIRVAPKLGRYTVGIGSLIGVVGVFGIIITLFVVGTGVSSYVLIPSFVVAGAGLGGVIAPLLNVILAGVPPRDAGSASGVLTTFQQLGGAIGVAIVGVLFFGLLSSHASASVSDVTPALRAQLTAMHVPPQQVGQSIATFTRCFEAQAQASDPTAPIAGCPSTTSTSSPTSPVSAAFGSAAKQALAETFVTSERLILFLIVGFWALTGLLSLLLPRTQAHARAGAPAGATAGAH
jgi:hypothetical protein